MNIRDRKQWCGRTEEGCPQETIIFVPCNFWNFSPQSADSVFSEGKKKKRPIGVKVFTVLMLHSPLNHFARVQLRIRPDFMFSVHKYSDFFSSVMKRSSGFLCTMSWEHQWYNQTWYSWACTCILYKLEWWFWVVPHLLFQFAFATAQKDLLMLRLWHKGQSIALFLKEWWLSVLCNLNGSSFYISYRSLKKSLVFFSLPGSVKGLCTLTSNSIDLLEAGKTIQLLHLNHCHRTVLINTEICDTCI